MGSKNEVLKFRSVKSIVIAPASTGRAKIKRDVVIKILQEKRGIWLAFINLGFIFKIVMMKFKELIIDEIPAKCKDKIDISTEWFEWYIVEERGG